MVAFITKAHLIILEARYDANTMAQAKDRTVILAAALEVNGVSDNGVEGKVKM